MSQSNIFRSIGFNNQESHQLAIKAQLFRTLMKYIDLNAYNSNISLVSMLTTEQLSAMTESKLSQFSIESLIQLLKQVGFEINVHSEFIKNNIINLAH